MCYDVHTTTSPNVDQRKKYKQTYSINSVYTWFFLCAERSNGGKTKAQQINGLFNINNHHGTNMENHSTLQHNLVYIKVEILYICDLKLLICLHLFQIVYVCLHDFE
jgi:hypothetical protein